ncbi:MAG: hypothetical protein PVI79_18305, partial [Gammaproteobacteria bacterium]
SWLEPRKFKQFTNIGGVQNLANFGRRLGNPIIRRFSANVLSIGRINTLIFTILPIYYRTAALGFSQEISNKII